MGVGRREFEVRDGRARRTYKEFEVPFKDSTYQSDWHKRHPEKRREYYLKYSAGTKRIDELKAEARARTEKLCTKCRTIKPMEEMVKSSKSRDGRASECLACLRARGVARTLKDQAMRESLNPKEILPEGHKRCTKCATVKTVEEFTKKGQPCKQCACGYAKAAYQKNPQKSHDDNRRWHANNPGRMREFSRSAYRKAHPGSKTIEQVKSEKVAKAERTEKACKKCKKVKPIDDFGLSKVTADGRHYQCKECKSEKDRERYAKNPAILKKSKEWAKLHPESCRQIAHRRRARKRGIPGSHTLKEWLTLCAKFKHRCVRCGEKRKLTRDHIIPISKPNSSNDISNIQPLCYSCNSSKNNRYSVDYRKTPFTMSGQELLFG